MKQYIYYYSEPNFHARVTYKRILNARESHRIVIHYSPTFDLAKADAPGSLDYLNPDFKYQMDVISCKSIQAIKDSLAIERRDNYSQAFKDFVLANCSKLFKLDLYK